MRKILAFISIVALSSILSQNVLGQEPYRLNTVESTNPPAYLLPQTSVQVMVVSEKTTVRTGPYARFAQKYLGAIAPLTDKVTYSIKEAYIGYKTPLHSTFELSQVNVNTEKQAVSHVSDPKEFTKSLPDRTSIANKSLEDMARDAAMSVFSLRKRRTELITGETGENVYGAGMKDAINEMLRMENELLALFFGKQVVEESVKLLDVVPEKGNTNYVAFRFSPDLGVMSANDVTGEPVVLMVNPENKATGSAGKYNKKSVFYQIPDWAECRLIQGSNELDVARIPVYQLGITVAVEGD